jgi:hypothetical protein
MATASVVGDLARWCDRYIKSSDIARHAVPSSLYMRDNRVSDPEHVDALVECAIPRRADGQEFNSAETQQDVVPCALPRERPHVWVTGSIPLKRYQKADV